MRRVLRVLGWSMAVLVVFMAALGVAGYLLVTRVPKLRRQVAEYGLEVLRREADVYLEVGHIESLDPFYADLRDVRVAIPEVGLIAKAEQVRVGFHPWALLSREVHFTEAWIASAEARFEPPTEMPEHVNEEADEAAETAAWRVEIHRIQVHEARLAWHGMPDYEAHVINVNGEFAYQHAPAIDVSRAELELLEGEVQRAHITSVHGSYRPSSGGSANVQGMLADAPFEVELHLPTAVTITLPVPFDRVRAQVKGLRREVWVGLGLEFGDGLRSAVDVRLDFQQIEQRYTFDSHVQAADARLQAKGWIAKAFDLGQLTLELDAPSLAQVHEALPKDRASGRIDAQLQQQGDRGHVALTFHGVQLGHSKVRLSGRARGRIDSTELHVDQLVLRDGAGELEGSGHYGFRSRAASARVRATAFPLGPLGALLDLPMRGVLTGSLEGSRNVLGAYALRGTGLLGALRLQQDDLEVQRLSFDVQGKLESRRREVNAVLKAEGLHVSGVRLSRASLRGFWSRNVLSVQVEGNGSDVDIKLSWLSRLWMEQGQLAADGRIEARGEIFGQKLALEAKRLTYKQGSTLLDGLTLRLGNAALRGRAQWAAKGEMEAALELRALPIGVLAQSLGATEPEPYRGTVSMSLRVLGTWSLPRVTGTFELSDVALGGMPELSGHAALAIDAARGATRMQVALRGGQDAFLELRSELLWPKRSSLADLPRTLYGRNYLNLHLPYTDLPQDAGWPALEGAVLDATLNLEGMLSAIRGQVRLSARQAHDAVAPLQLEAVFSPREVTLTLSGVDGLRKDAELSARALIGLPARGLLGVWEDAALHEPYRVEARFRFPPFHRMQGLLGQLVRAYALDVPIAAVGNAHLVRDGAGRVEGALHSALDVRSAALDPACSHEAGATGKLEIKLHNEHLDADLQLAGRRGGNMYAQLELPVAVLFGDIAALKNSVRLNARAENLPLSNLPYLCALDAGTAGFALRAWIPPDGAPETRLNVRLEGLSSARGTAVSGQLSVRSDARALQLVGAIQSQGKERGDLALRLPLRFRGMTPGVALTQPVDGHLKLRELPVAPLLQLIEGLGGASGTVSGDVALTGTLKEPRPQGKLDFDRVSFVVASLAQPVRELSGSLELQGHKLVLRNMEAHDRDGKIRLTGEADLRKEGGASGKFKLKTEQLPVRRQGKVMGRLSLGADITAKLDRHGKLTVDAGILYGTLLFSGSTGKAVQDLDPHPDIELKRDVWESEKPADASGFALRSLTLKSKQDLWIRHRDFRVQLGVDLAIVPRGVDQVLVGEARIAQGSLKLLGKSFTIQRGAVRFLEDADEPELDLRATYDAPSGGLPLSVQISGRASHPVLSFSGAADNADKAFAILSGSHNTAAAASAQADASSFGLGLTAGLVSMTARQELGAWVPTLSVGSNSRGQASQARAGFDASSLIPPALRRFARGAYVEGIVGETREGPGGSVGLGVRFELSLPRRVVTTVTYGPGTNWSADVAWVP